MVLHLLIAATCFHPWASVVLYFETQHAPTVCFSWLLLSSALITHIRQLQQHAGYVRSTHIHVSLVDDKWTAASSILPLDTMILLYSVLS